MSQLSAVPGIEDARLVGRGGFGSVFSATQSQLGRRVAVKLLDLRPDVEIARVFRREAVALGQLSTHPNVVSLYSADITEDGHPYFIMEYAPAGSLADRLAQSGVLPWQEVRDIGVAMCDALTAAHSRGIHHRDVKPDNILVSEHGTPLLSDFGIATIAGRTQTQSRNISASLAHASPEQVGGGTITDQSDIYSLGSTMYQLLTGRAAFVDGETDDIMAIVGRLATNPPPPLPGTVPVAMSDAIMAAMEKQADDRPASCAEFADMLRSVGPNAPSNASQTVIAPPIDQATAVPPPAPPAAAPPTPPPPPPPTPPAPQPPNPAGPGGAQTDPRFSETVIGVAATDSGLAGAQSQPKRRSAMVPALVALLVVAGAVGGWLFLRSDDDSTESATSGSTSTAQGTPATSATPTPPQTPTAQATATPRPTSTPRPTPTSQPAAVDPTGGGEDRTITVALVGNTEIERMAALAPDNFTTETGITVNFVVLDEQTLREVTTRDAGAGGESFDVVQIGMFEATQFAANGWLASLNDYAESSSNYDIDDLMPAVRDGLSVDGQLYASPFYAESSLMMYRQDVLDAAGLTMPDAPTWQEVADIARQIDTDDMAGICMRGQPGWGSLGATFTTMLNTFGGTWWEANPDGSIGDAQVDQPEFAEALNFYVDLLNDAGPDNPGSSNVNDCLTLYNSGQVAMWYDATVLASFIEADGAPFQGRNGFALAPTKETDSSGWLWAWGLAIPVSAANQDAAWEFINWATSAEYQQLVADTNGWLSVAPGTRQSLYANPNYQAAAEPFVQTTRDALLTAPVNNPGTTPRPGQPGVQFVGVPAFPQVGTECTDLFSSAISNEISVDEALATCQQIAQQFAS